MLCLLIVLELCFFQCLSLLLWLEERYETVYTRHPGFQKGSKPLLAVDNPFPMELPENLVGEKWAFVQLPFSGKGLANEDLWVLTDITTHILSPALTIQYFFLTFPVSTLNLTPVFSCSRGNLILGLKPRVWCESRFGFVGD